MWAYLEACSRRLSGLSSPEHPRSPGAPSLHHTRGLSLCCCYAARPPGDICTERVQQFLSGPELRAGQNHSRPQLQMGSASVLLSNENGPYDEQQPAVVCEWVLTWGYPVRCLWVVGPCGCLPGRGREPSMQCPCPGDSGNALGQLSPRHPCPRRGPLTV